jgi:hypothetical protein
VLDRHILGTGLALSMLVLGLVMTGLAAWIMVWAPHIAAKDAPHYSGLPVRMKRRFPKFTFFVPREQDLFLEIWRVTKYLCVFQQISDCLWG